MAFSKNRRLADLISADGTSFITSSHITDTSITPTDLHSTLDLTGKTVTVATASAGDNDTTVASTAFVSTAVSNLVASAPGTLNTLNELAAALGDDASFSTTVTNSIALKAPIASPNFTGNVGIGTASPGADLAFGSSNAGIWLNNDGSNPFGIDTVSGELRLFTGNSAAYQMKFGKMATDGTTFTSHLTIGDDGSNRGNVGIGTDTPATGLHVVTVGGTTPFRVQGGGNSGVNIMEVGYAGGSAGANFILDDNGNAGIGTNSPGTRLHISKDGGNAEVEILRLSHGDSDLTTNQANHAVALTFDLPSSEAGTTSNRLAAKIVGLKGVGGLNDWHTGSSSTNFNGQLDFYTRQADVLTKQMTIDELGNVGIGHSDPSNYAYSTADRNLVIQSTQGARLVLLGDSSNTGDTGEEDSSIYMLTDGGAGSDPFGNSSSYAFGYALKNKNYSGLQDFDITEWRNNTEGWNSRIYIQGGGVNANFLFNGGRSSSGDTSTYPNNFATPNSDFEIRTSGSMTVPKGTTGDRPSGATSGRLRFNTSTTKPEIHDGTSWKTFGYQGYTADWLVVAGGGSGGDCTSPARHGGGGGAGGLRTSYGSTSGGGSSAETDMSITPGTVYTITVGAGGSGGSLGHNTPGNSGANSSISGAGLTTITSLGGGGGGGNEAAGSSGGSGGGGSESSGAGQSGTSGQGYAGGTGSESGDRGGAGGGASAVGGTTVGGAGLAVSITGSSVTYAGGGGTQGAGGAGGGGAGSVSGTANTGGGGGAAGTISGAGGSGVVILRVPTSSYSGTVTGSPTVTTTGSDTVIKFTGSGTYTG